jgi:hypothetical protein
MGSAIAFGAGGAEFAHAAVKLSLSYVIVQVEASPGQSTYREPVSSEITINKDGSLRVGKGKLTRQLGREIAAIDPQTDEPYVIAYRVKNGAIVITVKFPGFTILRQITTNHKDSCNFSVIYTKIPGHKYYEAVRISNKEHMELSDLHAEELGCSVSETPD